MTALAPLVPESLLDQTVIGEIAVGGSDPESPLVAYTRRRFADGHERTELWLVPWTAGPARRLTSGPAVDTRPRFRPDGVALGFLRCVGDGPAQVWQIDLAGGALRQLTSFRRGVCDFDWTSDGRALAVTAPDEWSEDEVAPPPWIGAAKADSEAGAPESDAPEPTCRVISVPDWRADGEGLTLHRRHVHVVDVAAPHSAPAAEDTSSIRRLTFGNWSASRPRVGADGWIYFLAAPESGLAPGETPQLQVYRVHPDGPAVNAPHLAASLPGGVERFHLEDRARYQAPDSRMPDMVLFGRGSADARDGDPLRAHLLTAVGAREVLAGHPGLWTGFGGGSSDLFDWTSDYDDAPAATVVSRDGRAVPVDLRTGRLLVPDDAEVVCAFLAATPLSPAADAATAPRIAAVMAYGPGIASPDIYALEQGGPRRLTEHGSSWLERYRLPKVAAVEFAGEAGPIGARLVLPDGCDHVADLPGRGYPAVILLHGGPTEQWEAVPSLEAALLAAAGFLVVLPNPRGSIDRGGWWAAALHGAWGRVDVADVLAVCDQTVERDWADPARIGISGLSYGGFLVNWLVGQTNRFAAAVSENGVANQVSAWANCDVGPGYAQAAGLGDPLTARGVEQLWAASPLRNVRHVRTPLLMLQAEDDLRCPAADNEQFFLALRRLRRPVEYVLYPQESHLMQGIGRIDRRIDRHRRVLAHFRRHLDPSG